MFLYSADDVVSEDHSSNTDNYSSTVSTHWNDPRELKKPENITRQHIRSDGIVVRVPVLTKEQRSLYRVVSDTSSDECVTLTKPIALHRAALHFGW